MRGYEETELETLPKLQAFKEQNTNTNFTTDLQE